MPAFMLQAVSGECGSIRVAQLKAAVQGILMSIVGRRFQVRVLSRAAMTRTGAERLGCAVTGRCPVTLTGAERRAYSGHRVRQPTTVLARARRRPPPSGIVTRMMKLVRFVLLLVIATLMVSTVVVGVGTANTGPLEKVLLVAFGGLLILAALKVHKLGTGSAAS
jgi:hypothetical protein